MRRLAFLFVLLGFPVSFAVAQDQPFVRVTVAPETAIVGEAVTITVDVLTPNYFMGAPRFGDIDLPDAVVVFNDRGTNLSEKIGGAMWAGQRRSYEVYPQRPERYAINDLVVTVAYFDGSGKSEAVVAAQPFSFSAILPREAEGLDYFIAATKLTIDESFDVGPDTLHVGDAFVRTITVSVEDALAMVIPPLAVDSIPGIAIYRDPAIVQDDSRERGAAARGRRIERLTYVAQAEGDYSLPPVSIAFWERGGKRMLTRTTKRHSFVVLAGLHSEAEFIGDGLDETAVDESRGRRWSVMSHVRRWGVPVLLLAVLCWVVIRVGPGIARRIRVFFDKIVYRYRATNRPLQPLNPDGQGKSPSPDRRPLQRS